MIFNNYKFILKLIFSSKWKFTLPKSRKILIIDANTNPFKHYFKKEECNLLFRRGEEINISILFKCLLIKRLNILGYYKTFIEYANPKIILTAIDHYPSFYFLSKLTNIKTAFIVKGKRSPVDGLFNNKKITNSEDKKKYFVDYMFVYNKSVEKLYKNLIKGKTVVIGSFINNIRRPAIKNKKKEILWISSFKSISQRSEWYNPITKKNISHQIFQKNDKYVINDLYHYSKRNNLKFNILGRQTGENIIEEKKYYENLIGKNFNYIEYNLNKDSYKIMNEYEYIFTTWSTLGVENLVKNGKTGFIFNKPNNPIWNHARLGVIENLPKKGPFWTATSAHDKKEFNRIFNFVVKSNKKKWSKARRLYGSKLLGYDEGNKKFLKIVKNIIKK